MGRTSKRISTVVVGAGLAFGMMSGVASAHVVVVTPPGAEEPVHVGWAGAGALPGEGKGLVLGGPTGQDHMAPAHAKGLNTACETLRSNGNAAADLFGPPVAETCRHGF